MERISDSCIRNRQRFMELKLYVCSGTDKDEWNGAEENLLRVLYKVFPGNYCAIAQMIVTKLCKQVIH